MNLAQPSVVQKPKVNVKCVVPGAEAAYLPVVHGQSDARAVVAFPATRHYHLLASAKLYCFVTGTRV